MSEQEHSSSAEKSHQPTPQKIRRSREKGEVAYSSEATTAATYVGFFVALIIVAGWTATHLHETLAAFFHRPDEIGGLLLSTQDDEFAARLAASLFGAVAPLFIILALAALASVFGQRALVFAPSKLKPKLSKISIVANAKQKYGPDGLSEFAKSAAKLIAVMVILLFAMKGRFLELPALSGAASNTIAALLLREAVFFGGFISAAAVLIAAVDLPWRHFQHVNKLKMTHQEVKEETKETEGDPMLKSTRRNKAEAIAANRMMSDVPKADIVIVNPTHYAVALKWERENRTAPTCVAKGVDEIAARIRESAAVAGVPIKRDPPTARSIYSLVKIGEEIKKEHYAAVAAAIHYADKMRKKWKGPQTS